MILQSEVEDSEGRVATIHGVSQDESSVMIRLEDNRLIFVPIHLLSIKNSVRYKLPHSFQELREMTPKDHVFPVVEEKPIIEKKTVETSRIKIKKSIQENPETIEESLAKEEFEIERRPVNEVRDEPLQPTFQGDLTIIPVQEEILVVQKRILVREEILIRKVRTEHNEKVTVNLKKEEVSIDRKKIN